MLTRVNRSTLMSPTVTAYDLRRARAVDAHKAFKLIGTIDRQTDLVASQHCVSGEKIGGRSLVLKRALSAPPHIRLCPPSASIRSGVQTWLAGLAHDQPPVISITPRAPGSITARGQRDQIRPVQIFLAELVPFVPILVGMGLPTDETMWTL